MDLVVGREQRADIVYTWTWLWGGNVINTMQLVIYSSAQHRLFFRVGLVFFSKECNFLAFFCVLYKRMRRSLHFFAFFIKERGILCVLLHSFAFFWVLYKRTQHSLHSFAFFIKECGVLCVLLHSL